MTRSPITADDPDQIDTLCVNTIRTLSMDAVQQANRGMHLTPETPTYSLRGCGGLPADAGGV